MGYRKVIGGLGFKGVVGGLGFRASNRGLFRASTGWFGFRRGIARVYSSGAEASKHPT